MRRFSLIELLVVISVLAILGSLFFPSISKAVRSSQGMVCLENQRGIGSAFALYAGDNEYYPLFRMANSRSTNPKRWHSIFWDDLLGAGYDGRNLTQAQMDKGVLTEGDLNGSSIYSCPLDEGEDRDLAFPSQLRGMVLGQTKGAVRSYGMNSFGAGNGVPEHNKKGIVGLEYQSLEGRNIFLTWSRRYGSVEAPESTILLAETPATGYVGGGGGAATGSPWGQDGFGYVNFLNGYGMGLSSLKNIRYHNGGWNYLFVDGHVENLLPEDTLGQNGELNNPRGGYWSMNSGD